MTQVRRNFENELKAKLQQKSSAHTSEQTLLLRAFKYFDLDNSGAVDFEEWVSAIEKVGVVVPDRSSLQQIFTAYDKDRSGSLDYEEFIEGLFGETTNVIQRSPNRQQYQGEDEDTEECVEAFRQCLRSRGARGMIGLQRCFKIMDDDGSRNLSLGEFRKACRDFRVNIDPAQIDTLFRALDRDGEGNIDYDELLRAVRGPLNSFRQRIVDKVWAKLDRDGNGVLEISDIEGVYDPSRHPDVISGRKTPKQVLGEFLETFETHHNISDLSRRDQIVTKAEFNEYYANVSASIDDDKYFEVMMNNAWKLDGQPSTQQGWAGKWSGQNFSQTDQQRTQFSRAPQGTVSATPSVREGAAVEELLREFRQKLQARGARGFIGLQRQFKIMDDNNNKTLEDYEFAKAIKDFRVSIADNDIRRLFRYMDADGSGSIDYEELIHRVRGELNDFRIGLVRQAFRKLDKTGDGVVNLDDIRGVYNAQKHPDVVAGKKTEDEVLCEFLDTFEQHHGMFVENTRDYSVTWDEFLEYYKHVSASIDDDRYFELMLKNAWNFDNKQYSAGWSGDYTSQPRSRR